MKNWVRQKLFGENKQEEKQENKLNLGNMFLLLWIVYCLSIIVCASVVE